MKKAFVIGLILFVPFFLAAQQKENAQQDVQKQIESLKREMQSQISALRDSIALLHEQLLEQHQNNPGFEFFYKNPPPDNKGDWSLLDSLLREHSFSGNWNFNFPEVPNFDFPGMFPPDNFDYRGMFPPDNNGYLFDWKQLEIPSCPEIRKQKRKQDWKKMLPFYNLFKS